MKFMNVYQIPAVVFLSAGLIISAPSKAHKIYKADTGAPGGSAHSMMVTYAKIAKRAGIDIHINYNQTNFDDLTHQHCSKRL